MLDHVNLVLLAVKDNEDYWCLGLFLQVAVEVVADVTQAQALAVEIGQLFHLESTFLCNAVGDAFSAEEDMSGTFELLNNLLRFLVDAIKSFFHVCGKHLQFVYNLGPHLFGGVEVFILGKPNGD